jgi:hypothetical protein
MCRMGGDRQTVMYDLDGVDCLWEEKHFHQTAGRSSAMHFRFSLLSGGNHPRLALYLGVLRSDISEIGPFMALFVDCLARCSKMTGDGLRGDMFAEGDLNVFQLTDFREHLLVAEEAIFAKYAND